MIATSAGAPRQGARPRGRLPLPRRLANRDARAFNAVPVGRAYGHRQAGCAVPEREHTADQHRPNARSARGDAIPRIFEVLSVRRRSTRLHTNVPRDRWCQGYRGGSHARGPGQAGETCCSTCCNRLKTGSVGIDGQSRGRRRRGNPPRTEGIGCRGRGSNPHDLTVPGF
jgi:hypothetical protein